MSLTYKLLEIIPSPFHEVEKLIASVGLENFVFFFFFMYVFPYAPKRWPWPSWNSYQVSEKLAAQFRYSYSEFQPSNNNKIDAYCYITVKKKKNR